MELNKIKKTFLIQIYANLHSERKKDKQKLSRNFIETCVAVNIKCRKAIKT